MNKPKQPLRFYFVAATLLLLGCLAPLSFGQTQPSPASPDLNNLSFHDDTWHMAISPYLWMAGMDANLTVAGRTTQVTQSFGDIFSNLKFGFMGLTETRRGRLGILTDLMYIKLGDETAVPIANLPNTLNLKNDISSFTLAPYGAYRLVGNDRGSVDALVGLRYYHTGTTIKAEFKDFSTQSFSTTDNWADALGGGRLRANLTPKIHVFFLGDAGGGGSELTWQIVAGGGYQLSKRWSADLAYRRLYFNRQPGGNSGLEQTQKGLVLGATFQIK
jgi:hypothetical protein